MKTSVLESRAQRVPLIEAGEAFRRLGGPSSKPNRSAST